MKFYTLSFKMPCGRLPCVASDLCSAPLYLASCTPILGHIPISFSLLNCEFLISRTTSRLSDFSRYSAGGFISKEKKTYGYKSEGKQAKLSKSCTGVDSTRHTYFLQQ
jgi:hypothetical protein